MTKIPGTELMAVTTEIGHAKRNRSKVQTGVELQLTTLVRLHGGVMSVVSLSSLEGISIDLLSLVSFTSFTRNGSSTTF